MEQDPTYTDLGTGSGTDAGTTGGSTDPGTSGPGSSDDGGSSTGAGTTTTGGGVGTTSSGADDTSSGADDTSSGSATATPNGPTSGSSTGDGAGTTSTSPGTTTGATTSTATDTGPAVVTLEPVADSYVRSGSANTNFGAETILSVQSSGRRRALLRFDEAAVVAAVGAGTLTSAQLRLYVGQNGGGWGSSGRLVALHRMLLHWDELAVTWNCANDLDTSNGAADCMGADAWDMANLGPLVVQPTASITILNDTVDVWIELDVTQDVQNLVDGAFTDHGWILKKDDEGQSGGMELVSRDRLDPAVRPQLVLIVD